MFEINRNVIRKRQCFLFIVIILIFSVLYFKIIKVQYFGWNKLSVMADAQYSYKEDLTDANYKLFDSYGRQLMSYNKKYYVVILPEVFLKDNQNADSEKVLTLVYTLRNYNSSYDLSKIAVLNSSQKVYYEIDESTYNKLKDIKGVNGFYTYIYSPLNRSGVWSIENLLENPRRTKDNKMKSGSSLEMQIYNKTKNNEKPQVVFERDVNGNIIGKKTNLPKNNVNVRLTVDKDIEDKIKEVLNSSENKNYGQIGVVLMEASTGKIKALVQKDDNKPNVNLGVSTNHGFFPGSIFKVLVEEAGLDKNMISVNDKFTCRGLYEEKDESHHGTLTPEGALTLSCNDVFSQIGNKVGFNNFYDNAKSQGLFQKVLNLDSEKEGRFEVKNPSYSDGSLGLAAIGQNVRITPLEAISIPNTVINDGVYVKPYIVDSYVDDKNNVIEQVNTTSYSVIEKSTAEEMKKQMINVVDMGTAKSAYMNNQEVGGKTGSTQRVELTGSSKTAQEHSDGWFSGFFKANGRYYSMVVFVEDINKDSESGGNTAAPIFKNIILKVQQYLK
ncbi:MULTISPECIES: penicillin-binding transpeptidase domain-containing protein [Clostridium]|uniref:Predicted peptidoglycanglycosyltransferase n=3 Tax=Clostridium TaxID=1485 RepID=D8GRF5_CLOLD|nr:MULTISPECIES: penicillin-binding transpeptidase domain-containing protein [Clostridium]ADK14293.1 predicted peptidoglycanglycosyltransferase [Clostridium ljungdahlii DSM 13528]AGY77510.1 penicillin-binding transpeptidase domain-containing protein [Clostridium autoethanogenum DSM 10061]ALU37651.1 Penicillin-binding protein transpeptidase [Clostridium autoethanogenum DSM 10061]OAA88286.1 Stage V sporulation protein D [Clostridium ljungdahlii DSM 13528]OVY49998.1 Stage V sporulation protein D 